MSKPKSKPLDKSLWSPDAIGDIVVEVYKLRTEWGQGGDLARMEARDSPETIRKKRGSVGAMDHPRHGGSQRLWLSQEIRMMTAIPVNAPIPRLVREWIVGNTKLCVIDWGKGFFVACYLDRAGIANNISDHDTEGGAVTAANQWALKQVDRTAPN
jgi:hypothetical protein